MDKDLFKKVTESLKLSNRADLTSVDKELSDALENCYVDPVGENVILDQILNSAPCFLIGRKGTGKSTIFQKAQLEIEKKDDELSAYIDVKSIYENAKQSFSLNDPFYKQQLGEKYISCFSKYFILKKTLDAIYLELLSSVEKKLQSKSVFQRLFSGKKLSALKDLSSKFEELKQSTSEDDLYQDIQMLREVIVENDDELNKEASATVSVNAKVRVLDQSIGVSASNTDTEKIKSRLNTKQNQILMRYISFQDKIKELKAVCLSLGFNKIYLFFDDYSELSENAQNAIRESIIEPLYFLGDNFVNINVAAYPERVNYGNIDRKSSLAPTLLKK